MASFPSRVFVLFNSCFMGEGSIPTVRVLNVALPSHARTCPRTTLSNVAVKSERRSASRKRRRGFGSDWRRPKKSGDER